MTKRWRETEFALAKLLKRMGWPHAEAVGSGASGTDVKGTPGISWEVKARKGFDPMAWLRQNRTRPADFHPVVMRPNGMGPATIEQWPAFLPLGQLIQLLRLAGYGDPPEGAQDVSQGGSDGSGAGPWGMTLDEFISALQRAGYMPKERDERAVPPVPEPS